MAEGEDPILPDQSIAGKYLLPLLFYVAALPIAYLYASSVDGPLHWTKEGLVSLLGADMAIGMIVSLIAMVGAYLLYFATRDRKLFAKIMRFGAGIAFWFFLFVMIVGLLMAGSK